MQTSKAIEILQSVEDKGTPQMGAEEQGELVQEGLIRLIPQEEYDVMQRDVQGLDSTSIRVRDMARSSDTSRMAISIRSAGSAAAPGQSEVDYCKMLQQLESMLLHKAILDSSAFCPGTGSYFVLTADGKRTLEDMKVWSKRFGRLDLKEFLIKLHDIRFELATTVNKALNITRDFQGFGYGYSVPDARAPSLMLAERGSTAARTVNLLNAKGDQIAPRGEKLMIASLLGEKEGVGTELVTRYRQLTAKANEMGMTATDDDFRSAALVGLPDEQVDQVLERVKQLKLSLNLNENDLTWLALSDHTVEQSETRYSALLSGAQARGMQEDAPLITAMAILAGSDLTENVLLDRFDFLQGALQRNYPSPRVAAAMLAIGPLEPEEALFVLRESVGIISRASYFDDAEEVDNLALLLATTNSIMIPPAANAAADQGRGSAIAPGGAALFLTPLMTGAFLYYWMNRNYHQPTIQRIATHPMHMHTVPYFG